MPRRDEAPPELGCIWCRRTPCASPLECGKRARMAKQAISREALAVTWSCPHCGETMPAWGKSGHERWCEWDQKVREFEEAA